MAPYIGTMAEFDPEKDEFEVYIARMKLFFTANTVSEAKKASVFLTLVGGRTYSVLRDLLHPEDPGEQSFDVLAARLLEQYAPKRNKIAERFKFHRCKQLPDQTVSAYVAQLKKCASTCDYGTFLEESLRDKLIEGLKEATLQRELLKKSDVTFKTAVEFALAFELTVKTSDEMQGLNVVKSTGSDAINAVSSSKITKANNRNVTRKRGPSDPESKQPKPCFRCNGRNHNAATCRFKNYKCNSCGKTGHLGKACRNKVQAVDAKEESSHMELYHINSVGCSPYVVNVQLNGKQVEMQVDTGAGVSIISSKKYNKLFKEPLKPAQCLLSTYSNSVLEVLGKVAMDVVHAGKRLKLNIFVVRGDGPTLLGRDWLKQLKLDWTAVYRINSLDDILTMPLCLMVALRWTLGPLVILQAVASSTEPWH
ncbi:uncharacterized protein LOC125179544 [Hyalella azteca]|uniref:Uncharacterized protein LOC125179544 n=1 Tax=Hyalella azteca TaxID=294128 RepID=A0A979FWD7_HYAAZ|nr:uncharacterized protein LOC125179544 [Hyalella azteca]